MLGFLALLAAGWGASYALGHDEYAGVRCKLCRWSYRTTNEAEGDRIAEAHMRDAHPSLFEKKGG